MHLAILAGDRHTMVGLLVACDVLAEKKLNYWDVAASLNQNSMQVCAIDNTVGKLETLLKCLGVHWDRRDLTTAYAVAHNQFIRKHR